MEPSRLHIRIQSEQGSLLVVSENWMPGWRALSRGEDGQEQAVQVRRTNLTSLGARVVAPDHTIDLVCWPASVRCGLIIRGVTLIDHC